MRVIISESVARSSKQVATRDKYSVAIKPVRDKFEPLIAQVTSDLSAAKKSAAKGRKALEKVVADAEAALKTAQEALNKYDAKSGVTKLEKRLETLKTQYREQTFKLRHKYNMR